jgi:hypothetical protein
MIGGVSILYTSSAHLMLPGSYMLWLSSKSGISVFFISPFPVDFLMLIQAIDMSSDHSSLVSDLLSKPLEDFDKSPIDLVASRTTVLGLCLSFINEAKARVLEQSILKLKLQDSLAKLEQHLKDDTL